ncbi:BLOC1S2 (predicted) [Pycnogonum litorale]
MDSDSAGKEVASKSSENNESESDLNPDKEDVQSLDASVEVADDLTELTNLSKTMFSKATDYIQGELEATVEDYHLIEEMNRVTINKYSDMKQVSSNINKSLIDLSEKYKQLEPYLKQIDEIDAAIGKLETAANKLDAYSKRLESKFKILEQK